MFLERHGLFPDPHAARPLNHKIKLLHFRVAMEGIRAFRWQAPEPGAEKLAFGPLEKIRIRNLHHIGRSPREIFRLNYKIPFKWCHSQISITREAKQRSGFSQCRISKAENGSAQYPCLSR